MSERILVVDDDERIAAIVRDGLTRMGYRVALAADGPVALVAVGVQPLDLVVLDVLLAGMANQVERLLAGPIVPAWRELQARGALLSVTLGPG